MDLTNARVLVTGGSSGIGRATAEMLRERGASVAICGRDASRVEEVAGELGAVAIAGDVSLEADANRIVSTAIEQLGGLDVLVNNAGFGKFGSLVELDVADMDAIMATNVRGATLVARACAQHFVSAGEGGNIINVASTAASKGFAGGGAYCASKFALTGLTECWRAELRQHNVRVMQINPSEVITEFSARAGWKQDPNPTKLHGEDIAHAIVAMLEMNDRGFTTELTVFATNPR
jgi:3-oxoacyl-[acyl-carrier protein] reductase